MRKYGQKNLEAQVLVINFLFFSHWTKWKQAIELLGWLHGLGQLHDGLEKKRG